MEFFQVPHRPLVNSIFGREPLFEPLKKVSLYLVYIVMEFMSQDQFLVLGTLPDTQNVHLGNVIAPATALYPMRLVYKFHERRWDFVLLTEIGQQISVCHLGFLLIPLRISRDFAVPNLLSSFT